MALALQPARSLNANARMIVNFFNSHFQDDLLAGECVNIRALIRDGRAINEFYDNYAEAAQRCLQLTPTHDVYFGIAPRKGEAGSKAGSKAGISRIVCLHADVDAKCFNGDDNAAYEALFDTPGLPFPSTIVQTGGGLHAYWRLATALNASDENIRACERIMGAICRALGVDRLTDVSRILRVPGSVNFKYSPPQPVRVIYDSPSPVTLDNFDALLDEFPVHQQRQITDGESGYMFDSPPPPIGQMREWLKFANPCLCREQWCEIMFAVHSVYPDEEGFNLIDEWSSQAREDNNQTCSLRTDPSQWWRIKRDGTPGSIGIGTLKKYAKEGGWEPKPPYTFVKKAARQHELRSNAEASPTRTTPTLCIPLSSVTSRPLEWLWDKRIPLGGLTIIDGDPGLGKSTVTLDLAARVSTGRGMPGGGDGRGASDVLILTTEDPLEYVVRPRLETAGANLARVHALDHTALGGDVPTLPTHAGRLHQEIERTGASLVIVDPFVGFLDPELSYNNDQHVRRALAALAVIAETTGAAIVLVRHLNKRTGGPALYRGGGSIGIIGAARAGLVIAKDPADPQRRVLAQGKTNLGITPRSLSFALESVGDYSQVRWLGESDLTAEDILEAPASTEERSALDEAQTFLREVLSEQRAVEGYGLPKMEVIGLARKSGISEATLTRGKKLLGVESKRVGFGGDGVMYWRLPRGVAG